jgi:ABC-type thiamine transport system ATPase subunit
MTELRISGLSGRSLRHVTATLGPGLHVLLALDPAGSDELIPLLDGSTAPRRGTVLLDNRPPYRTPGLRSRIGSLWARESMPNAASVLASLQSLELGPALLERVASLLDRFGVGDVLAKPPAQLDQGLVRVVALAVALSKPEPLLLVLHEPLAFGRRQVSRIASELILAHASRIPVLIVTKSRQTALTFGGPSAELGGGFWRRMQEVNSNCSSLRIVGANLRSLASELVRRPRVHTLRLTNHTEGHDELWLETSDPRSVSMELVRVAEQLGVRIWSLSTLAGTR